MGRKIMRKANLNHRGSAGGAPGGRRRFLKASITAGGAAAMLGVADRIGAPFIGTAKGQTTTWKIQTSWPGGIGLQIRSEEHTSELPSLMRISYAVFCLKKNK